MKQSTQPMSRYGLTQALIEETYRGSNHLFREEIRELAEENDKFLKTSSGAFFFNGMLYGVPTSRARAPTLAPSLCEKVSKLLSEHLPDSMETKLVTHFFVSTTNKTMSMHDLVKVFPVGLHQILVQFQDILVEKQVQPDAWLDIHIKQNERIRAVIEQKLCFNLLII